MDSHRRLDVAVLLSTHNGERYVAQQVESLSRNETAFTLHWLDDQSDDDTREAVRSIARKFNIDLREWHQGERLGVPGAFFQLLECVEADIYLFCDQDDIWQPGKIDAAVRNLKPDLSSPVLCFTDPLIFKDGQADLYYRALEIGRITAKVALQESRIFMPLIGYGHTEGFTRPLRDIYMAHRDIARSYAMAHDVWFYAIAVAAGTARLLTDAPTTLYRQHVKNFSREYGAWRGRGFGRYIPTWRGHQVLRRKVARNAEGFILASPTLRQSGKLERLLVIARLVSRIHRRQSPVALLRLAYSGAMWPSRRFALGLALACLCSDAKC